VHDVESNALEEPGEPFAVVVEPDPPPPMVTVYEVPGVIEIDGAL
jgi:hypothetical protein